MDITFTCPNCNVELEVDSSAAGSEFECPACSKRLTVPKPQPASVVPIKPPASPPPKQEKHFVVPHTGASPQNLITKASRTLEVAAKDSDKKMRIRTIRRSECMEVGKDHFDERVSEFLDKVGQANIISVSPVSYGTIDSGTHQTVTDYGVLIVFRG